MAGADRYANSIAAKHGRVEYPDGEPYHWTDRNAGDPVAATLRNRAAEIAAPITRTESGSTVKSSHRGMPGQLSWRQSEKWYLETATEAQKKWLAWCAQAVRYWGYQQAMNQGYTPERALAAVNLAQRQMEDEPYDSTAKFLHQTGLMLARGETPSMNKIAMLPQPGGGFRLVAGRAAMTKAEKLYP